MADIVITKNKVKYIKRHIKNSITYHVVIEGQEIKVSERYFLRHTKSEKKKWAAIDF